MNPQKIVELEIRVVSSEVLVHDARHGMIHVLNTTAGRVLELCDGTRDAATIAAVLAAETGGEPVGVGVDVNAILEQFAMLGIV